MPRRCCCSSGSGPCYVFDNPYLNPQFGDSILLTRYWGGANAWGDFSTTCELYGDPQSEPTDLTTLSGGALVLRKQEPESQDGEMLLVNINDTNCPYQYGTVSTDRELGLSESCRFVICANDDSDYLYAELRRGGPFNDMEIQLGKREGGVDTELESAVSFSGVYSIYDLDDFYICYREGRFKYFASSSIDAVRDIEVTLPDPSYKKVGFISSDWSSQTATPLARDVSSSSYCDPGGNNIYAYLIDSSSSEADCPVCKKKGSAYCGCGYDDGQPLTVTMSSGVYVLPFWNGVRPPWVSQGTFIQCPYWDTFDIAPCDVNGNASSKMAIEYYSQYNAGGGFGSVNVLRVVFLDSDNVTILSSIFLQGGQKSCEANQAYTAFATQTACMDTYVSVGTSCSLGQCSYTAYIDWTAP